MARAERRREMPLPGLRGVRVRRLLSVLELASASGVSAKTLHLYENGRQGARMATVRKLVAALGCSVDELVGTTG